MMNVLASNDEENNCNESEDCKSKEDVIVSDSQEQLKSHTEDPGCSTHKVFHTKIDVSKPNNDCSNHVINGDTTNSIENLEVKGPVISNASKELNSKNNLKEEKSDYREINISDGIDPHKQGKQSLVLPKENLSLPEACKSGKVDLVRTILSKSSDMINVAVDGWTCLHDVSMRECQFSKIAEILLENGANVNIQDESGNTPLHIAIIYHCIENINILLKYNADMHKRNKQGASSIDTACNIKDNEILAILGQQPVLENKKKKVRRKQPFQRKQQIDKTIELQNLPTFYSPPILKKRKLDSSEATLPVAKKHCVQFSD